MRRISCTSQTTALLGVVGVLLLAPGTIAAETLSYDQAQRTPEARALQRPLACRGFCMVTLKLDSRWAAGEVEYAATHRGRTYLFADLRKRDIFAAAPDEYTPLLGGDCPVTWVDAGERAPGELRHGVVHRRRLLFFATATHAQRFAEEPARYFTAALEAERRQQEAEQRQAAETPPPDDAASTPAVGLSGYCPVTLKNAGRWERGGASYPYQWLGLEFRCAGPVEHAALAARPEQFFSAAGGYCPVTYWHTGQRQRGHADFVAEYRDRLYLFATAEAKQQFLRNPELYSDIRIQDPAEEAAETRDDASRRR